MEVETFVSVVRVCALIIAAICFLGGLGFLIFPKAMVKLTGALNRSFSIDRLQRALEKPIDVDRRVIGIRVVVGIIALVVSIVIFLLVR